MAAANDVVAQHDVRYDYAGFLGNHPRLTCRRPGCKEATLVHQPYMSEEVFARKIRDFLDLHPPKDGQIIDDDGRGEPLLVKNLIVG